MEFLNVLDWVGSKIVWLVSEVVAAGNSVDHSCTVVSVVCLERRQPSMVLTQRSAEPVSKSRVKVLPGVPIVTGQRYSESFCESSAGTSPVWSPVGDFFWRSFCIWVFPPTALLAPCLPW